MALERLAHATNDKSYSRLQAFVISLPLYERADHSPEQLHVESLFRSETLKFAQLSGGKPPFRTCIRRSLSHFGEDWSLMTLHVVDEVKVQNINTQASLK